MAYLLSKHNAQEIFEDILHDAKAAALAGNWRALDAKLDELRGHTSPFLTPTMLEDWDRFGLSGAQTRVANLLHTKLGKAVSKDSIMDTLYFDRPDDAPHIKIIDIYICHIRRKLKEHGDKYCIETVWGRGYRMREGAGDFKQGRHWLPRIVTNAA